MNPPRVSSLCLPWSLKKGHQPVPKHTSRPGCTEDFLQKLGTQIGLANSFLPSHPFFPRPQQAPTNLSVHATGCESFRPSQLQARCSLQIILFAGGNKHGGRDKLKPQKQIREWTALLPTIHAAWGTGHNNPGHQLPLC